MAEGWSWIIGGIGAVLAFAFRNRHQVARIALRGSLGLVGFGFVAGAMMLLSRADARGESLPSDSAVRILALLLQLACLTLILRRLARTGQPVVRTAAAYGAVIATAGLLAPVGAATPGWIVILAVTAVAGRFAVVSVVGDESRSGSAPPSRSVAFLFVWSVAVMGVQSGILGRENGLGLLVLGLLLGLTALLVLSVRAGRPLQVRAVGAAATLGLVLLVTLFALIPTRGNARFLFDVGFDAPAAFDLRGERLAPGYLERWYATDLGPDEAVVAAHRGMSAPVSEWAPAEGSGIDGHLYGYRLDVRAWNAAYGTPLYSRPPAGSLCRTESGTCVLVRLSRSDDRDDEPVRPLRLGS
ncbi:MAG: hypothetical protein QOG43_724 [Actinomycetota bacterium]|jgi:hypothetical protein|nr:hypothetical protein [Actinomycetota bacterium]